MFHGWCSYWKWSSFWRARHKEFLEQIILSFLQSYLCDNINSNRFFWRFRDKKFWNFISLVLQGIRLFFSFIWTHGKSRSNGKNFFWTHGRIRSNGKNFFEHTVRAVLTARIFFKCTAGAVRTARKFFERMARAVQTASQSVRTADKRLLNGYPLRTFLRERSQMSNWQTESLSFAKLWPHNNREGFSSCLNDILIHVQTDIR